MKNNLEIIKNNIRVIVLLLFFLVLPLVFILFLHVDGFLSVMIVASLAVGYVLLYLIRDSKRFNLSMQSLAVETEAKPIQPLRPLYSIESYKHSINNLNKIIGTYDVYTMEHNKEVALLTLLLSEKLDIVDEVANVIYYAGLIHDIGKIHIKDEIINKPFALTEEEFGLMKGHSERGYEMIRRVDGLEDLATPVLYHHERWDGSGYPHGLKGHEIPIESQIISICDTVSAMKNTRVYSNSKTKQQIIIELIYQKDKQFNAYIVDKMLEVLQSTEYENL